MYVIRLQESDLYYTGRAGDHFVSDDPANAFTYRSEAEARIKAQRLSVGRLGRKFVVERAKQGERA